MKLKRFGIPGMPFGLAVLAIIATPFLSQPALAQSFGGTPLTDLKFPAVATEEEQCFLWSCSTEAVVTREIVAVVDSEEGEEE